MKELECEILSSFINYPEKMNDFFNVCPRKCFSDDAKEALNIIETLQEANALSHSSFANALSVKDSQDENFLNILSALPNPNVENLAAPFVQSYLLESQRQAALTLLRASDNNTLLTLEEVMPSIEQTNYRTLSQWKEFYANAPKMPSFKTGIDFLDSVFNGGLDVAQLVLISGDPEAGKTTLGLQILEYIAKNNKICFFSFEFPIHQYLQRKAQDKTIKADNMIILDNGYEIYQIAQNIKNLYKQGVRVFLIDSQMRIVSPNGRNMEEEESLKFSCLAKLCHSLNILVFLIVQTSKGDRDNPMGSKKGGHEASIIIRIEHDKPENANLREFSEDSRIVILKKNKQTGKHYKERVAFDSTKGKFYSLTSQSEREHLTEIDLPEIF
ncbi:MULTISPECIES: DnaB-like helicase C-terminal domain-containing protein [unclassified Helicobacter]|uniref:RAD55 family ATPase n=1 Tax=unclassified Helicobacter TaxID=2593540 RepID=UPI00051D63FD|nr:MULTISPECIES: DnaB-like helicase C-terminal domain-containing protein [unclassified Helicobacter]